MYLWIIRSLLSFIVSSCLKRKSKFSNSWIAGMKIRKFRKSTTRFSPNGNQFSLPMNQRMNEWIFCGRERANGKINKWMSEGDRFISMKTMVNMKYKLVLHSDWVCDSDGAICDGKTFCSSKIWAWNRYNERNVAEKKRPKVCKSVLFFSPNNEKLHKSISRIFVGGKVTNWRKWTTSPMCVCVCGVGEVLVVVEREHTRWLKKKKKI